MHLRSAMRRSRVLAHSRCCCARLTQQCIVRKRSGVNSCSVPIQKQQDSVTTETVRTKDNSDDNSSGNTEAAHKLAIQHAAETHTLTIHNTLQSSAGICHQHNRSTVPTS
eukprot:13502-Heterococcus_DN1.PRE.4